MSTKRPKLAQVGRQMGQNGHQEGPGGRKRGPSWSQDGPSWSKMGQEGGKMGTQTGQDGAREAQIGPEGPETTRTQNFTILGPLLEPVLEVFSGSRRSSEAFGGVFFFDMFLVPFWGRPGK